MNYHQDIKRFCLITVWTDQYDRVYDLGDGTCIRMILRRGRIGIAHSNIFPSYSSHPYHRRFRIQNLHPAMTIEISQFIECSGNCNSDKNKFFLNGKWVEHILKAYEACWKFYNHSSILCQIKHIFVFVNRNNLTNIHQLHATGDLTAV